MTTLPYTIQYRLNGQLINSPVERFDTTLQVNYEESAQGSIETSQLTFVNEAYTIIQDAIKEGLSGGVGITEGLPFEISIQEGTTNEVVFDGFVNFVTLEDLTGDNDEFNEPKILVELSEKDGIATISTRLEGLTFALLEANRTISPADWSKIKSIVEKEVTFLEQAFLGLAIYMMLKEIYEASLRLADQIATINAILVGGGVTGSLGSFLYAVAAAIFETAYITLMVINIKNLIEQFKNNIVSSVEEFNCINFYTALTKIFQYLGYTFFSPINELREYVYLPSKAEGRQDKGIPFDSDFGFVASEFVELCLRMFRAEIFVRNGQVQMRTKSDPFFETDSNFVLPSVLEKSFSYNLNELKESRLISFQDDISDSYTVSNWKGTSAVITTTPITQNNPSNNLLTGLQEVRIPLSLGNAKTELSALEKALNSFYKAADSILSVFGQKGSIQEEQARINILKISQPFFNNAKVLKVSGDRLASDYRTGLSAKYLWDNYLNYDSFVNNNFKRQRKDFEGITIPFSYQDYKKLKENSYFVTENGKRGKFTSLEWNFEADKAEASFWIEEVYTKNLREEITEVE